MKENLHWKHLLQAIVYIRVSILITYCPSWTDCKHKGVNKKNKKKNY